jgi:predicted acetyltransferase
MALTFRTAKDSDWEALCYADGRAFGFTYTPEQMVNARALHDVSRFELAFDGKDIVAIVGAYSLQVTVPGSAQLPMGGLTWVSTAATHRRQGLLTKLMSRTLADIDRRGEPLAMLGASEGGIYERYGFGVATQSRSVAIDRRRAELRPEFRPKPGAVRFVNGDEASAHVSEIWPRFHHNRVGEVNRTEAWHRFLFDVHSKPRREFGAAFYLAHRDGYAIYRIQEQWNDGGPAHNLLVTELVATTADAHAALWHTLLGVDLVGRITSGQVPIDDPLPFLLTNPRALETTALNDGHWANVRDVVASFGARCYNTIDRLVIEVDGMRWVIDGGPEGSTCKRVKSRPDLTMDRASLGPLLLGGVRASALAAGRRLQARDEDVLRRADNFFTTSAAPHCQTSF